MSTSRRPAVPDLAQHTAAYLVARPAAGAGPTVSARSATETCLGLLAVATRQRLNRFVFAELRLPEGSRFPDDRAGWERVLRTECDRRPALATELCSILELLKAGEQRAEGNHRGEQWEQLLHQACRVLGEEHPASLHVADRTALIQDGEGRADRARALCEKTWKARERVLGPGHQDTLVSALHLARVHVRAGRVPAAVALLERSLLATGSAVGAEHPLTMLSALNLADAYAAAGRDDLAGEFYAAVHAEAVAALGAGHELTLRAWGRLRAHRKGASWTG